MSERDAGRGAGGVTRRAALGLAAAAPLAAVAACRREPAPPPGTVVPLAALPPGERVRFLHGEEPIELLRHPDDSVTAHSLWCTHMGCEVRWNPASNEYLCPCHDGRFSADGRPIAGPPTRPLRTVALLVEPRRVVIPNILD